MRLSSLSKSVLVVLLIVVCGTPPGAAYPPITNFCGSWTLGGTLPKSCTGIGNTHLQAGQLATQCWGTETAGEGWAQSPGTYTIVSGASVGVYEYTVLSSDSVSYDYIFVDVILGANTYRVDTFNPGGGCGAQTGAHVFVVDIPGITGVVSGVKFRIGVHQDNYGDTTWADITAFQVAP